MDKLNFWKFFKEAFILSWHNKKLWWFGLIIGSGSSLNLNLPFPSSQKKFDKGAFFEKFQSWATDHFILIAFIFIFFLALAVIFWLFKILAYSCLIRELMSLEKESKNNFWKKIQESKKYFWKILEIKLIFTLLSLALILILALPVIFLFSLKSFIAGSIIAFLAILILIPAFVILFFIEKFGVFYIITSNLDLKTSLEQGYKLLLNNIGPSIIMALLFIPLNILIGVALLLGIAGVSLPFVILGVVFYQLFFLPGAVIVGFLGGVALMIFGLALRSFLGVFYNAAWFLFFKEIATAKKEEVEIKEEVILTEEIQPEKI